MNRCVCVCVCSSQVQVVLFFFFQKLKRPVPPGTRNRAVGWENKKKGEREDNPRVESGSSFSLDCVSVLFSCVHTDLQRLSSLFFFFFAIIPFFFSRLPHSKCRKEFIELYIHRQQKCVLYLYFYLYEARASAWLKLHPWLKRKKKSGTHLFQLGSGLFIFFPSTLPALFFPIAFDSYLFWSSFTSIAYIFF